MHHPQQEQHVRTAKLLDWLSGRCGEFDKKFEVIESAVEATKKEQRAMQTKVGHSGKVRYTQGR